MRMLGLIGGIAPESTIAYYRQLVEGFRQRDPGHYPRIVINSIEMTSMRLLVEAGDLEGLTKFLAAEIAILAAAGAELGAFASNTPHLVFEAVARQSAIPLVSIVEVTAAHVARLGLRRVGLLGARFTMEAPFYPEVLGARGISVVTPPREDRDEIHRIYFDELVHGDFRPESRAVLLAIIERLHERENVEAVILGGTELPLILEEGSAVVPLLDTTRIHVAALLERAWKSSPG